MSVSDILSSSLLKASQVGGPYSARSAAQSGSNNPCHIENPRKIASLEQSALPTLCIDGDRAEDCGSDLLAARTRCGP